MVIPVNFANQHQNRAEQEQQLHKPQRSNARQHRNRVQQGLRDGVHRAAHADVEIPRHPVQHEQPQGRRHEQLPRPIAQECAIPLPDDGEYPALPDTPTRVCPSGYTLSAVQSGQSYADLLVQHNVSYRAMRSANPQLMPGYLIAGTAYCAPPSGTRQTCAGLRSYTIQPRETLDTLAVRFRTTRGRLLSLNPTLLPSDFSSGTVICIG